jgi:hypothetical protein
MNYGSKLQIMCGIIPLMLFKLPRLVTDEITIMSEDSTKSFLACICTYHKAFIWVTIFKIGALVSNSFNKLKFSSLYCPFKLNSLLLQRSDTMSVMSLSQ